MKNKIAISNILKVRQSMPYCIRCGSTLPRPTNNPCRDPKCALSNMSLAALWRMIEERPRV